jgi:glutamate dehydrogenase
MGCNIVGVSTTAGGHFDKNGLNIPELFQHFHDGKVWSEFENTHFIEDMNEANKALFESDVDILIPAALEDQLTAKKADLVQAKVIIEAANGPTTPKADQVLNEKGIFVVPDVLASSGGVIVSYFEWVQDTQAYLWPEEQVNKELEYAILKSYNEVLKRAVNEEITMRMAAYENGIERLAKAIQLRGYFP